MPSFKNIRNNKYVQLLTNRYVLISIVFIIWMLFLDTNSFFIHHDVNQEKELLEKRKADYLQKIKTDKEKIKALENDKGLESFARENYYIKRPNEDIYIIEIDSTSND